MKNSIKAVLFTFAVASAAQAQQAVQWKVVDGGNGHWYAFDATLSSWQEARAIALGVGGDLASLSSAAERAFWMSMIPSGAGVPGCAGCTWLGGFQDRSAPDYAEPSGGWRWSDGTPWSYAFWNAGEPNDIKGQDYVYGSGPTGGFWDDSSGVCCAPFVIEWSADCNNDGIVDYGQCRDGTLPDYNGNNVPDCCEAGTPCLVGSYPVQWRVQDGGNGHWYELVRESVRRPWSEAKSLAAARGGHLATFTSAAESAFFVSRLANAPGQNPWIGLEQLLPSQEPAGGWRWITGEPLAWTNWAPGEPNNVNGNEHWAHLWIANGPVGKWNDYVHPGPVGYVAEWSADCNGDGIVDCGQVLQGQLPDANTNGVPDGCECAAVPTLPACCAGDLNRDSAVDGADLGTLLNSWGDCPGTCPADFDRNGFVDGADLGVLLGRWGPCGG
jgi:hypothetical protein